MRAGADGGAALSDCIGDSDGGARPYCLLSTQRVRVAGGAKLRKGEAVLVNADDNTAVILARDAGGLYARSGICTHACCIVSLCDSAACGKLTPSPLACEATDIVKPDPNGGIVCPCHGSRFSLADGSVLNGPARTPLPAYEVTPDGEDAWVDTGRKVDPSARVGT
jgi:Rieske Fe-S protein